MATVFKARRDTQAIELEVSGLDPMPYRRLGIDVGDGRKFRPTSATVTWQDGALVRVQIGGPRVLVGGQDHAHQSGHALWTAHELSEAPEAVQDLVRTAVLFR